MMDSDMTFVVWKDDGPQHVPGVLVLASVCDMTGDERTKWQEWRTRLETSNAYPLARNARDDKSVIRAAIMIGAEKHAEVLDMAVFPTPAP